MTAKELDKYIELYKNGDQEAFSYIYNETYQNVYYTIFLLTKNISYSSLHTFEYKEIWKI